MTMTPETFSEIKRDGIWNLLAPEKAKEILRKIDNRHAIDGVKRAFQFNVETRDEYFRGELSEDQFEYEHDRLIPLADELLMIYVKNGTITQDEMAILQNAIYYKPLNRTKPNQDKGEQNNAVQEQ